MKKKVEIEYNTKEELITMIVRLWENAPTYVAKQQLMEFLISNYRGVNLSSLQTLKDMPYNELEKMYLSLKFLTNSK
jgi:hypothetical protein